MGLTLIIGGGLSNLFDRVLRGGVIDFIDLGWGSVFNLADVFITLGLVLYLYLIFKNGEQSKNRF